MLTLYTAADLLTTPGCSICRYVDEVGGRYLAWFALDAHADAVIITRLCKSLGMCPRHTRELMSQPGAAHRLTAVYRYVVEEAMDRLSGRAASIDACPACEHYHGAVGRALDTLLDDLTDESVRERCRELGGLCIPHLATAAARGDQRTVAWLSDTMTAAVTARQTDPSWLAGTDYDVDARAVLRRAAAATARPGPGSCIACLAAARSQNDHLTWIVRTGGRGVQQEPDRLLLLCAAHLGDVVAVAGQRDAPSLLAWQAGCLDAAVSHEAASSTRRKLGAPTSWVRLRRRADGADRCPACLVGQDAARRAVDDLRASLRASHPVPCYQTPLCVRHLLGLQAADPWAGHVTARGAIQRAEMLLAELNEAFGKNTWTRRHEARGPEMTAWRRAAAFLDGGVFFGCPPRDA